MAEANESPSGIGIPFYILVGIVFIGLKVFGTISWSWLWVLAPIWIPLSLALLVNGIAALVRRKGD